MWREVSEWDCFFEEWIREERRSREGTWECQEWIREEQKWIIREE